TETAAQLMGLAVYFLGTDSASRVDGALAEMARDRPDGMLVLQDAVTAAHRREIAAATLRMRLPAVFAAPSYVGSGGLLSYRHVPSAPARPAARPAGESF